VVPRRNGFLVPARNPRALAEAIERLIVEPGLQTSMGLHSRRLVEERFDVQRINAIVLNTMGLA
jgi:glycosyltransferase involved in cell wall biosynthesis